VGLSLSASVIVLSRRLFILRLCCQEWTISPVNVFSRPESLSQRCRWEESRNFSLAPGGRERYIPAHVFHVCSRSSPFAHCLLGGIMASGLPLAWRDYGSWSSGVQAVVHLHLPTACLVGSWPLAYHLHGRITARGV